MVNFTGHTKKRVVNLGGPGRSLGGGARQKPLSATGNGSSTSYLEIARAQRIEREEQRAKERAIVVLQSYIKRYLEMLHLWDVVYQDWKTNPVADDRWVAQFKFLCKWKRLNPQELEELLSVLLQQLRSNDGINKFTAYSVQALFSTIEKMLKMYPYTIESGAAEVLECMVDSSTQLKYDGILKAIHTSLVFKITPKTSHILIKVALSINVQDSYDSYLEFLAIPKVLVNSSQEQLDNYVFPILKPSSAEGLMALNNSIDRLTNQEKVHLLSNIVGCFEGFSLSDYLIIGTILSHISFIIATKSGESSVGNESSLPISKSTVFVSQSVISSLEVLYSSNFIRQAFGYLSDAVSDNSSNSVIFEVISSLLYFIPTYKARLCMLITITPGSYGWLFNRMKDNTTYQEFISNNDNKDYMNNMLVEEKDDFWKIVYTFEELYSYWLIVSNDLESFNEDKLSIEDVSEFMVFLKSLCLTLILDDGARKEKFRKLKDISISLLNQLYLKNLRLRFVSEDFWQLNEPINIDHLLLRLKTKRENRRGRERADAIDDLMEVDEYGDEDEDEEEEEAEEEVGDLEDEEYIVEGGQLIGLPKFSSLEKRSEVVTHSKLEILEKVPFFIPFKDRVLIFQALVLSQKEKWDAPLYSFTAAPRRLVGSIRREFLVEDAFKEFHNVGSSLKYPLSVTFINEYGPEAGIGEGITKEFLTSVVTEGFKPNGVFQLFKETSLNQLYPNEEVSLSLHQKHNVKYQQERLLYFKFLGSIIGKCFYESILIDISFAPFFLTKWCNANRGNTSLKNSINDLNYLDKDLFHNLMKLTTMTDDELRELDLTFTINEKVEDKSYTFNLMPDGEHVSVNSSNRLSYIHQVSNFKLNSSLHIQTKYFLDGLFEIIPSKWLRMFDAFELQMLVLGGDNDVNVQDWKENVQYGGYFDDDLTIKFFWEVVNEMSSGERFKLIKFVTSVSRVPLLGFGALNPKFGIRNSGRSIGRLPTASTCVNLLKLPDYQDKALIKEKLLYAINTDAKFDLS